MIQDSLRQAIALYDRFTHEGMNRRRFMGESRSYVAPVEPAPIEAAPVDSRTPAANAAAPSSNTER